MRRYETVVILDPDLEEDDIRGFTDRYAQLIKSTGGEVIKIEDWGQKKLAYLVKKRNRGRYVLLNFVGLPALMQEIERQFKISDEVIKFLTVKLEHHVDLEAFKAAAKQEAVPADDAKAATEHPPSGDQAEEGDSELTTIPESVIPPSGEKVPVPPAFASQDESLVSSQVTIDESHHNASEAGTRPAAEEERKPL